MKKISFFHLLILASLAVFLLIGNAYRNQSLSFHFVDEEDNIVLGSYLLKNEKLYSDLFSHHQPLAYIFSAGVQKVTHPNTLYLLIKRHRETMIAWSALWIILLVWRFRLFMLLTFLIYEPLKIFLLGNLFLSESLIVYPLAYLLAWVFAVKKNFLWEIMLLGFCLGLAFLLLSPLWPVLLALAVFVFWKVKSEKWGVLGILGGTAIPLTLVLKFISIPDYFFNAFYINFNYYIPATSSDSLVLTAVRAFTSPLLTFTNWENNNATLQAARLLSAMLIISCLILLKKRKWKLPLFGLIFLGLSNIRFVSPGQESYSGFHLLPWFMALILLTMVVYFQFWKEIRSRGRYLLFLPMILLAIIVFNESNQTLFAARDIGKDFYINYSRQADFGEAVKIMKTSGETLFVVPDEWLIYWQADIPHASKMVNYYAWMTYVPEIRDPLHEIFMKNSPTYFYCDHCQFGYFGLEQFFSKYQNLERDGQQTNLMVLRKKLQNLNQEQKKQLEFFNFKVPD